jgi:hypothetical protein
MSPTSNNYNNKGSYYKAQMEIRSLVINGNHAVEEEHEEEAALLQDDGPDYKDKLMGHSPPGMKMHMPKPAPQTTGTPSRSPHSAQIQTLVPTSNMIGTFIVLQDPNLFNEYDNITGNDDAKEDMCDDGIGLTADFDQQEPQQDTVCLAIKGVTEENEPSVN